MIQLVRALQMVLHLPMMRILMPPNALMFIGIIIEIAMFDILPAEYTTDFIFEYDDSLEKVDQQIFGQMRDIGYESHSSIKNLGSLTIFTALYFAKIGIIGVMWIFKRFSKMGQKPRFLKIYNQLCLNAFFYEILAILLDAYFEFLISGYQQNYERSKFSATSRLL